MKTVLWQNTTNIAVYKGGMLIQAGETREIPAHWVTVDVDASSEIVSSDDTPVSLETLLQSSLRDIEPILPDLALEQLQQTKQLENNKDKPRKGVIDAIDAEILKRATPA